MRRRTSINSATRLTSLEWSQLVTRAPTARLGTTQDSAIQELAEITQRRVLQALGDRETSSTAPYTVQPLGSWSIRMPFKLLR